MKKELKLNLLKIFSIFLVIVLFFAVFYKKIIFIFLIITMSLSGLFVNYEKAYVNNDKEFNEFAVEFMEQDKINNMAINIFRSCEIINDWGFCFITEKTWSKETGKVDGGVYEKIYLDSKENVLEYENISKEEYEAVKLFLSKYKFNGIGKNDDEKYIEISGNNGGVRYYLDENVEFKEDNQYILVKNLNDHWYFFANDWN